MKKIKLGFRPLTRIHLLLTRCANWAIIVPIGFRPLTRIHLLLTERKPVRGIGQRKFPTSDEDSSTPDSPVRCLRFCQHHVSDL